MLYFYLLSSFAAGFALMTVELVGARVVAPLVGSSVFTWTSVIGVTLLGLSVGSFIGGIIIDKRPEMSTLGLAFIASSILVFIIPLLLPATSLIVAMDLQLPTIVFLVSVMLFILPAIAIGFLQPMILKLYADDFSLIGKEYGTLSALWSLGSILGVFLTGFYFVATFGSSLTIQSVAALLAFFGVYFLAHEYARR